MLLYLDTETTGFSPTKNAIIQVAAIPVLNGENLCEFNRHMKPFEGAKIDDGAFKAHGISRSRMEAFNEPEIVIDEFIEFLYDLQNKHKCKFTMAAHNAKFDQGFIYEWFCRQAKRTDYMALFRPIVRCVLERAKMRPKIVIGKRNLGALCTLFRINLVKAHDAIHDTRATIEVDKMLGGIEASTMDKDRDLTYKQVRDKYLDSKYVQISPTSGDVFIQGRTFENIKALEFILDELYSMRGED